MRPLARRIRWRRLAAGAAVSVALFVAANGRASAAADPIQLVRGSSYEIREEGSTTILRVPIVLAPGLSAEDVTVQTIDVALGQGEQAGLAEAFVPSVQGRSGSLGPALLLSIRSADGLRPGTYDVIVDVQTRATTPDDERLDLRITHPAAALQAPSTVMVERSLPFFPWQAATVEPVTLQLKETSGLSRVSNVTITQLNASRAGEDPVSGRLRFDHPVSVSPRGVATESFALDGNYPVGTTTGTVEVDGPQLQTPISVNFEVHTRLSVAWLFVVAASGLLVGAIVRTWLKAHIALEEARLQAGDVLRTIDQELAHRADQQFQSTAGDIRKALVSAMDGRDAKAISEQATRAAADLQGGIAALAERREAERKEFEALTRQLSAMPAGLKDVVEPAQAALSAAAQKLADDDVSGATSCRKAITGRLVQGLREVVSGWQGDLSTLGDYLTGASSQLDAELLPDRKDVLSPAESAVEAPSLTKFDAEPSDVLAAANDAYVAVTDALQHVVLQFLTAARRVAATLRKSRPTDIAAIDALEASCRDLAAMLPGDGRVPSMDVLPELPTKLQTVLEKMGEAISKQEAGDASQSQDIQDSIDAGKFLEAAGLMAALLERPERPLVTIERAVDLQIAPTQRLEHVRDARTVVAGLEFYETRPAPSPVAVRLQRARRSLLIAQVVQSLLLGVVVLVIAYVLYSAHFVGSGPELAAIFLWAFAIDITVDSVLTAVRGTASR